MKKLLAVVLMMAISSECWALLGIEALKKTVNNNNQKIEKQTKDNHMKLGVIEKLAEDISATLEAEVNARAQAQVGYGNKINEVRKDMRDEIQEIKTELNFQLTKISNKQTEINKTLTKTSIKQNQASIFFVLAIILGVICISLMVFAFFIVSKFARASTQSIDLKGLVDKYEKEIDGWRERGLVK